MFSFIIFSIISGCYADDNYVGKSIGELNSYNYQVGGDVFAVDQSTLLLKNFMYDGNGKDTFFWAGSNPRPGPQGFIVPNEHGRTNILEPYASKDITIKLPDNKRITDIKWFAVYDLTFLESFGDVYIPEGFQPPQRVVLAKLSSKSGTVSSKDVTIIDSKTIHIKRFRYNGVGEEVYFWVGSGPQPNSRGFKIPDEHGYMTPLRAYDGQDVTLVLPGDNTVFTVDWLAVYDVATSHVHGSIIIPEDLNVPPSLVTIKPHVNSMPNCEQLHKDLQVSWDVFGDTVTIEIAAQMGDDDYAAFGISGDPDRPKMIGGDAVVVYRDDYLGNVKDYNLSSYFPCTHVLNQPRGVCDDGELKGQQDYQVHTSTRQDGISVFTFRRRMTTPDTGDIPYPTKGPAMIIWAIGRLDLQRRPTMHYAWSKDPQLITFTKKPGERHCFGFTQQDNYIRHPKKSWTLYEMTDPNQRNFTAVLGPDGGPRGYSAITGQNADTGLVWYINGQIAPEIVLQRGITYRVEVMGGSNPYDPAGYHPFIITDEAQGGYSQLNEEEQEGIRILAGVAYNIRGDIRTTSVGPLCQWKHRTDSDRRRDVDYTTFAEYRNSLLYDCNLEENKPGMLKFTPNKTWPDVVYYNSWTGYNMGWKINIVNSASSSASAKSLQSFQYGLTVSMVIASLSVYVSFSFNSLLDYINLAKLVS